MNKPTSEYLHVAPDGSDDVFMIEPTTSHREPPTGIISCPRETHYAVYGTYDLTKPTDDDFVQGHRYNIQRNEKHYVITVETPTAQPLMLQVGPKGEAGDYIPYKYYTHIHPYSRGIHYMTRLHALGELMRLNDVLSLSVSIRKSYGGLLVLEYGTALDAVYCKTCNLIGKDLKVPPKWVENK